MTKKSSIKQLLVGVAPVLAACSNGGALSFTTVLLHQLKAKNSSIPIDFETSTWVGSIHGLAGIPSTLMPMLMQWRGRKFAFIAACAVMILGWILAFSAQNVATILLSECLHGFATNSILVVSFLSISEMIAPKYREPIMQIFILSQSMIMGFNSLLTHYLHWKTIALLMCVPVSLSVIVASAWPESPYWLAYKGRINKCKKEFVQLRGSDEAATKELEAIISKQRKPEILIKPTFSFSSFLRTITSRDFLVPAFHMFVMQYLVYWSGGMFLVTYGIEIFFNVTQNATASFYSGIILNGFILFGTLTSMMLNKFVKRKTLIIWSVLGCIISLGSASIILYLQKVGTVSQSSLLSMYCMIGYMVFDSTGAGPLAFSVASSLMPVRYRGIGGILIIVFSCVLHSSVLKFSPYLVLYLDMWGTFLVYTVNTIVSGAIIWKYIPETEGMTLQEIDDYYTGDKVPIVIDDNVKELECILKTNI